MSLCAAGLILVQNFDRSAVKPAFAIGESVVRPTAPTPVEANDWTTARLPPSKPSPGPFGISSAKNCETKTVSSSSLRSPSLVTATAHGLPPTGTVPTTWWRRVSITDTVPSVKLVTKSRFPFGVLAHPRGSWPTGISATTSLAREPVSAITDTVPLAALATKASFSFTPSATQRGSNPTVVSAILSAMSFLPLRTPRIVTLFASRLTTRSLVSFRNSAMLVLCVGGRRWASAAHGSVTKRPRAHAAMPRFMRVSSAGGVEILPAVAGRAADDGAPPTYAPPARSDHRSITPSAGLGRGDRHASRRAAPPGRRAVRRKVSRISSLSGGEALDGRLEPPAVEAQAVPRQQLGQVLTGVGAATGDVLHAVRQHAVPVPVVGAEAREVLAQLAECLAEVGGSGVVRLEAEEDLPAPEEVDRVVVERAVLHQVRVGVGRGRLARRPAIQVQRLAELAKRMAAGVGPDALAQQLACEPPARHAGSRVEVADAVRPGD